MRQHNKLLIELTKRAISTCSDVQAFASALVFGTLSSQRTKCEGH